MPPQTIILDFRLQSAWDRGIAQGITEFGKECNWDILLCPPNVSVCEMAITWNASVVVSSDPETAGNGRLAGTAFMVAVGHDRSSQGIPSVCSDNYAVGAMAATHLMRVGLQENAVFAYGDWDFSRERADGFRRQLAFKGGVFYGGGEFSNDPSSDHFCSHQAIIQWLIGLPKPCGIFANCDDWARALATYCRHLNLRVPEDIALIGVDNDLLACELSSPPLSSVAIPWREMAGHVVQMIAGHFSDQHVPAICVKVQPIDVVARRSTDTFSIENQQVSKAVAWIHQNAHRAISVDDVVRAVQTYRQRLERQFRVGLGCTVMEEVRRAHINVARTLLKTTDLPMPSIAARSGFTNATMLGINFRKEVGQTPRDYRRSSRGDAVTTVGLHAARQDHAHAF